MEFHEKLQQLRHQAGMTQEQLAEKLYISRTAVSKWESGKGYPNIESLKSISALFSVSIDQLLSGEELVTLAERDTGSQMAKLYDALFGGLDVAVLLFIILPFFGENRNGYIYSVSLLHYTGQTPFNLTLYWTMLTSIGVCGAVELLLSRLERIKWLQRTQVFSVGLEILGILYFMAAREPYVTMFMFLLFLVKLLVLVKLQKVRKVPI